MASTYDMLRAADLFMVGAWELEPEDFDARLQAWLAESADKGAALRALHASASAQADKWKREADACTTARKRAEAIDDRAKTLVGALLAKMRELGEEPKIPGVARLQRNGGSAPLVSDIGFDEPPDDAPADLVKTRREWDLAAIRTKLARGESVPGFALGERKDGVRWE